MKFTKNRLLSLLLVLAMMLALATTAFAEGGETPTTVTFDASSAKTMTVGEANKKVKATCAGEGETHNISYASADTTALEIGSADGEGWATLTAKKAGTIKVTATCSNCNKSAEQNVVISKATVAAPSGLTVLTKSASTQAEVKSLLDQKYTNATITNKDKLSRGVWTLTNSSFNADEEDSTYSSTKDDTMYFRATLTVASGYTDGYEIAANTYITATVTFQPAPTAEIKTQPAAPATCMVGDQNKKLSVTAEGKKADGVSADVSLNYQWYCATTSTGTGTPVATDKGGKTSECTIDTATAGTYYYYCVVTASQNGVESAPVPSNHIAVKVNAQYTLSVDRSNSTGTSTPHVGDILYYTATLRVYDPSNAKADKTTGYRLATDADYDSIVFTPVTTGNASTTATSSTNKIMATSVYLNGVSSSTLTSSNLSIKATVKKGSTTLIEGESASITFYPVSTRDVYIAPTTATYATMDESSLLSAVQYVRTGAQPRQMIFRSNCGTFNYSNPYTSYYTLSVTNRVSNTTFTPNTYNYANFSNNPTATFYATDDNGNYVVATGTIRFSAASSITYSTTASTPVYFKASDFTDFFKTAVGGTYASSYYAPSLTSVTFSAPRVSTGSATLGTLNYNGYTYGSSYYNTYFNNIAAANLGYVSYTPSSSTSTYTVSVPFTAVGTYSGTTRTINGTVTIKVNDGHVITMVGTDFKSASIWSDITSKHPGVSYVSFSQPQSTVGKLYYGYSSIASKGSLVSYTDRFNNSNYNYSYANTIKSIDGIYFVPAADCLDTVTLTYTAYTSATATTGVSDTITFTITKKTASSIFNDVTASNTGKWSADAIDFLARNSIVEGGSYGTFNPNGNMTRGDFVLMLYRMAGKPSVSGISNPFTDVKSTDYYYNAILWAYRNDIVTGVDAKTFAPKKNITREQIAATLYRMAGSPSASGYLTGYYDYAKIHSYATNAMRWAISNGVITGSNGYLTPTNNATRAQVAAMLHRYLTK